MRPERMALFTNAPEPVGSATMYRPSSPSAAIARMYALHPLVFNKRARFIDNSAGKP